MDTNIKTKILFNSSDKDIINYPIEEAQVDVKTGMTIWDPRTQTYKKTGNTLEWTIRAGETLEFPYYVADYLRFVYGFLKEVKGNKNLVPEKAKAASTNDVSEGSNNGETISTE